MSDTLVTTPVEKTTPTSMESQLGNIKGRFVENLTRSNKVIRTERALAIAEGAEMHFRRTVEDAVNEIKQLKREREATLDFSPATADSLMPAINFDAKQFVQTYLEYGRRIREKEILLEIAKSSYEDLFGNL